MNIAFALYLALKTVVLWAALSAGAIALFRAADALGQARGWWS